MKRDGRVLMLTGSSDFGLVGAAMALDVDAFVVKPVSQQGMRARLEKALSPHQALKSVEDYEKVDIDAISQRLLSHKPVGLARSKVPVKKAAPNGIKLRIDMVKPGAVLAEDVRSPGGELLIGKATVLNERLIRRLIELQEMTKIDYLYIFPQSEDKKA
jgi:hypothetical protein